MKITNWSGNLEFGTEQLLTPADEAGVAAAVRENPALKVIGSRHSFSPIADSTHLLLSLEKLSSIRIDEQHGSVTIGAGIRYGTLSEVLHARGFALHNLASLPHISVAGACATATHGSGIRNGNLTTGLTAFKMVMASGELRTFSLEKNQEELNATAVHLGALGVVTELTLKLQPSYAIRQQVYESLPLVTLGENADEILRSGYSLSFFTDWKTDKFNQVWLKQRMPDSVPASFYGAKKASHNLHPIGSMDPENCTEQLGIPAPWHERLPHFKMNFTPSSGAELQAEYFVPNECAFEALTAIRGIAEYVAPCLLISEIRTIAADDFWMSPCYQQDSLAIHFTLMPDWTSVQQLLPRIENALAPFDPRPHWGKVFTMDPAIVRSRFPRLRDFQRLCETLDPTGKFSNAYLNRYILS